MFPSTPLPKCVQLYTWIYIIVYLVNDLACNKSPGLDGVSAEHMKFAGPKLG